MKSLLTALVFILFAAYSSAQYNTPTDLDQNYCSHLKSALEQQSRYYFPISTHPLLDAYDVHFYFLDIEAENNTIYISGNVTIKATVTATVLDTFAFELVSELTVDSVLVNGTAESFSHEGDHVFVPLSNGPGQGQEVAARIYYHGTPPSGGFFTGISTDYNDTYDKNVTWTLSEPYGAKEWFPVKQDLHDKADSVWVFVTTSQENMAGSQGLLTNITPMPQGKLRYEWKSYYPIAYYLISIAVADYQEYNIWAHPSNMEDSILIQNFIYDHPDYLPNWEEGINNTVGFLELFSEIFGPYPFAEEKYGHCVSEIGGAMEHQTMTTLGFFNYGLVAHELGHMWFGDNVTCAYWNDIWVNEGFATYSDYLAHHYLTTPFYDSLWLKIRHDHVKSEPGGSIYVPDSLLGDVWRIFSGRLSYSKGALMLHMLRFELQDDDLFFDILTEFGVQYGDSVATGMDFKELAEDMSGEDLDVFFDQWYFGEGYPVYDIVWNHYTDTLHIYSTQTASTTVTPFFDMLVPYHVTFTDGTDTTLLLRQTGPLSVFAVPLQKNVAGLEVDPDQWILHELNSISFGLDDPGNPVYFSLGPNPAREKFYIFLQGQNNHDLSYHLTDISGRLIDSRKLLSGGQAVDISFLQKGIYMITVSDGKNALTRRVVKIDDF
jgi:aminopeptidase N